VEVATRDLEFDDLGADTDPVTNKPSDATRNRPAERRRKERNRN
jgi:hypothetical protein